MLAICLSYEINSPGILRVFSAQVSQNQELVFSMWLSLHHLINFPLKFISSNPSLSQHFLRF